MPWIHWMTDGTRSERRWLDTNQQLKPNHGPCDSGTLFIVDLGDPWGQAVAAVAAAEAASAQVSIVQPGTDAILSGPLKDTSVAELIANRDPIYTGPVFLPVLAHPEKKQAWAVDLLFALAERFPNAFAPGEHNQQHIDLIHRISTDLIAATDSIAKIKDQGDYQRAWSEYAGNLDSFDKHLAGRRFLLGNHPSEITFADYLLFAFAIRINSVYYELFKANAKLLEDLPNLFAYVCDLYELPQLHETTDFEAIKAHYYLADPILNPNRILPVGGQPRLHWPQFRASEFAAESSNIDESTEENQDRRRSSGEWVRPASRHRNWITPEPSSRYPAEPGRYHLYAPYNCPWSHRTLLARAVKGLDNVIGATVLYFRRDPAFGWQVNPAIPGCNEDPVYGIRYLKQLYARVHSEEKSAPVLWDTKRNELVSNESADILRMFNHAFGELATRADLDLYPPAKRKDIDRINELVYQRINNGAYKAGFASSQPAYERAYWRYFDALAWLNDLLADRDFLAATPQLTEADLRLFPTVFRHDAIYFTRFKLNHRRIHDYPNMHRWLQSMMEIPGVATASNLDHARNGYFGRTGSGIVPAGPIPLGLSRADFADEVWLNRQR